MAELVASYIAVFYMLDINVKRLLNNEFNTNLLGLGPEWWRDNLTDVMLLLSDKYCNVEAAQSTQDFVNSYNRFF